VILRNVAFRLSCETLIIILRNFYAGKTGCYMNHYYNGTRVAKDYFVDGMFKIKNYPSVLLVV